MPAGGGATGATGTVREYVWLYETEIAPTFASRTTVDRPLAVVSGVNTASPATWWVSVDHLNRPVKMTDSAKAAVWSAVWSPWGAAQSITGSATLNARFPGQWFQVEAGLHYNWHRHYDPTLGRYTQPDPLGFVDGPSVYGYARGAPLTYVDPDGRFAWLIPIVLGGALGASGDYLLNPEPTPSSLILGAAAGAFGGGAGRFAILGREICVGKNFRFAPFGNRTGHRYGRWIHYHRRGSGPGQGIKRHRPWERKSTDKSWRDRF